MLASLNGIQVQAGQIVFPYYGLWVADLALSNAPDDTVTDATIVLAGLTLQGTVFRGGSFLGNGSFRVIGGKGGWKNRIPPKFYQSSFGVKLRSVLTDVAREVSESVQVDVDRTLGQFYTREACPAGRLLWQLGRTWWVRADGVTQIGTRAPTVVTTPFDVLEGTNPSQGRVMVATDNPESWEPGVAFVAPTLSQKTVSTVIHHLSPNALRTEILTTAWT
jgi:hypothetical protein